MKIDHEFTVDAPIDVVWDVLTDIPAIAPCMPGATLLGDEQDESGMDVYQGKVKVKIGPVVSEYKGTAAFVSKDRDGHHAVIDAKGKDSRGAGNAAAVITLEMRQAGDKTTVSVGTDLKISGKIAQFGSSMIREVSEKLLGQFVDCLAGVLHPAAAEPEAEPAAEPEEQQVAIPAVAPLVSATSQPQQTEAEPLDLLDLAGGVAAKRLIPLGAAVLAGIAVIVYIFRR